MIILPAAHTIGRHFSVRTTRSPACLPFPPPTFSRVKTKPTRLKYATLLRAYYSARRYADIVSGEPADVHPNLGWSGALWDVHARQCHEDVRALVGWPAAMTKKSVVSRVYISGC